MWKYACNVKHAARGESLGRARVSVLLQIYLRYGESKRDGEERRGNFVMDGVNL